MIPAPGQVSGQGRAAMADRIAASRTSHSIHATTDIARCRMEYHHDHSDDFAGARRKSVSEA
jgi:hypothetical protein